MEAPVKRQIIGSIVLIAGLGLLTLFGYHYLTSTGGKSSTTPGTYEGVIQPAPESLSKLPDSHVAQPREAVPPMSGPAASSEGSPGTPSAGGGTAAMPALEPTEEPGLLAGKFLRYKDAKGLLAQIQRQKIPAFIRKEGNRYGVWAGPFATNQEAEQARKKLQMALKISPKLGTCETPVAK